MSKKFSQFAEGGTLEQGDIVVGLREDGNDQFDFPGEGIKDYSGHFLMKWLADTDFSINWLLIKNSAAGQPVVISSDGIDENVSLEIKSHADGTLYLVSPQGGDIELALGGAGDIRMLTNMGGIIVNDTDVYDAVSDDVTLSADSSTTLPTQHAVKTYVDNSTPVLSQTFITNTDETGSLPNSDPLSTKATGILASTTATGALNSRTLTGTPNEIDIINGDGSADPTFSLSSTLVTPGTTTLGGTLYVTGQNIEATSGNVTIITDGASAIDLDSPTVLIQSEIAHGGDANNKIVFGTDTQNFETGGSSRIDIDDTGVRFGASNARVTTILTDTTMSAASDTNLYTGLAIKTYVDTSGGAAVTLSNAGTTTLVNDGVGPDLFIKGLVASTGISFSTSATDVTIINSDPASGVTLSSAGGTETLVNDGTGPALFTKGISASTGISLSSDAVSVTVTNSSPASSVTLNSAGGTETLVNDGVGPDLLTKGLSTTTGLTLSSNATSVTYDLTVPVTIANGGTNSTSAIGASGTLVQSDGTKYAYTTATYPAIAGTAGTVLRSNATNWINSTSTFADTYSVSTILYASSANTVTGLATANSAILRTTSAGVPGWSASLTDGQLLIGSTGGTPTAAALTQGTGITITNGAGSITIAASGGGSLPTVTNSATLVSTAAGSAVWTSTMTNGQLVIGNTSGTPTAATLTQGTGMTITNGAGTITIALSTPVSIANGGTNTTSAIGATGTLAQSDGTKYTWTTATYPTTAGTSGKILISNGTNIVSSTPTYPNSATGTGKVLRADGTNWVASTATYPDTATSTGTFLRADGTNWVASTATIPATAGTSGTLMQSNGTNWVNTTATYPGTSGTSGTILRSNGTNIVNSTATFADTYSASTLLYSNGANTVTGLATANSAALVTTSAGVPVWSGTMTNGQLIIGSTSGTPTAATLTAGSGITITNGAGSITIATTGTPATVEVTGTSQSMAVNTTYIANNASLVTLTLPTTAALGDFVVVLGKGAGLFKIAQNASQVIRIVSSSTTTGTGGSLTAIERYDSIILRCITANTDWIVVPPVGTWTIV